MRTLYAVFRKEMGHYFVSPIAYVFVGLFLGITGFLFHYSLVRLIQAALEESMRGMQFGSFGGLDVPTLLARGFFGLASFLLLFFVPILTMGLYAEERKGGTMELLMTSPITDTQIVLGKFFAGLTLFILMLLPTAAGMIYAFAHSDPAPPWRTLLAGYLGVLLLGGALLALGSFLSSLTESQLIAAIITFAVFLILWVIDIGGNQSFSGAGAVLQYLSVIRHFEDFARGVIDTTDLVYYGSLIALGIFLTIRSIESMRWRRA